MTERGYGGEFYVAVAGESGEPDLVADIVFSGSQVADVRRVAGTWIVTLYDASGSDGFRLPLDGFLAALRDASERLRAK